LVLTSSYPVNQAVQNQEIASFISKNYCGVKRLALRVNSVTNAFDECIANGAIPIKFPEKVKDEFGFIEHASIKLFDDNEITFINRNEYKGFFKPGYVPNTENAESVSFFDKIDHIASEVRINEASYWTDLITRCLGTNLVQSIQKSLENTTGMLLNVNQSDNKGLTLVIAQP
jgi:4-hydroxyphenylpyruvate dioxygenase